MRSKATGAGCVALFGLPFAGFGLMAVWLTIAAYRAGEPAAQILYKGCFAAAFTSAGFAIILGAFFHGRSARQQQILRDQHFESPWLWKPEWVSRRIPDDSQSSLWAGWTLAIIWNAVASPALVFVPEQVRQGNYLVLLALLFPLVGLFLVIAAVRATMRALRFRRSVFLLDTLPAPIGGALRGRVEVPYTGLRDASSIIVRLTQTVTTRSGKSSTTSIHWQEEMELSPALLGQSPEGVTIPIDIGIPSDASPSDLPGGLGNREWRLSVDAELPGIDYAVSFVVPVFPTAFTDVRPPRTLHTPIAEPRNSPTCRVTHRPEGLEIYFPPFRAPSVAIVTLILGLLFASASYVLVRAGAPLFFPIFCGFLSLLLLWASYGQFFGRTTIVIDHDTATVRYRALFGTAENRIRRDEIASVDLKIDTQQSGGRMLPWYTVQIHPVSGRRIDAVNYIRSKREAEWVAAQIRRR